MKKYILEAAKAYLSEGVKFTSKELRLMSKKAKEAANKTRKMAGPLSDDDAEYLEDFSAAANTGNLKRMNQLLHRGETDNREDVYRVIADVVGKEKASEFEREKH